MESQWEISRFAPTFEPLEERLLLSSQFIGPLTLGLAGTDVSGAPGALLTDAARASAATPAELISALTPSSEGPVVKATPLSQSSAPAAPAVLYATGFEAGEGSVKASQPCADGLRGRLEDPGRWLDAVGPGVEDHAKPEMFGCLNFSHDGIVGIRAHGTPFLPLADG